MKYYNVLEIEFTLAFCFVSVNHNYFHHMYDLCRNIRSTDEKSIL